ncbi:MAG: CoA transferase [Pseudomonadales bacterium]
MDKAFDELMAVRGLGELTEKVTVTGHDPVLSTRFKLGETAAAIMAAIGVAVNDLWELKTGRRQNIDIDVQHAAAALRSYVYLNIDNEQAKEEWRRQRGRQGISTPHPTKDGRYFLPHVGLPHLAERVLSVLKCDFDSDAIIEAVSRWNALELEEAIAEVKACGAMVRTAQEWAEHPQGQTLHSKPVIEIIKIGDSEPEPMPEGARPLEDIRVLDLTRILAGPTCARTLAEHGADVLMVGAEHLPQSQHFVMDTSHGKRTTFLDITKPEENDRLRDLVKGADVFSQGYRTDALANKGFSPEQLAEVRPGIIYTSMNSYGFDGPWKDRAGWEQLAQAVTGIAAEHGRQRPTLLPAAASDYSTGYLGAYGTLLALALRARQGGSWHVRASLCQSGMFLYRQERVDYDDEAMDISRKALNDISIITDTPYGKMTHLGPILGLSETPPKWTLPSSPLGTHEAVWL